MRSYQVTHYEGENMGPIDWAYDFLSHLSCMCASDAEKRERIEREIPIWFQTQQIFIRRESLVVLRSDNKVLQVLNGDWWRKVMDIGMYDGWPYWRPTPAMFLSGTLGGDWHFFGDIRGVRLEERPKNWQESPWAHHWR